MPHLTTSAGQRYTIPDTGCVIGRGAPEPGEPLVLDVASLPGGRTVSRRHARLVRMGGHWWLRVEPESHNPVLVGERRIQPGESVPLGPHDSLRLGDLQFTFDDPDAAAEQAPEPPPRWAPAAPPASESPALAAVGPEPLQRVNPFAGLMIDETVWDDAHTYHRRHAALHQAGAHGWGLLEGLEVLADSGSAGAVLVRPGVAVDPLGRTVVLTEARRCVIEAAPGTTVFVALRLDEVPAAPQDARNQQPQDYTRIVESAAVTVALTAPEPPALELARLVVQDRVRNAADPFAPVLGEIDLRYREALPVRRRPELLVVQGLLEAAPAATAMAHQQGLRAMLREVGATTPLRPRWSGAQPLSAGLPAAALLYVATTGPLAPSAAELAALGQHLSGGGLLWIDCCSPEAAPGFAAAAAELAQRLGRSPAPVRRGHPLVTLRHLFGVAPGFAGGAPVLEDDGLVVSSGDLGCAWQGGPAAQPLDRAAIRTALEVGVNAAVYAHRRMRPYEALLLDG